MALESLKVSRLLICIIQNPLGSSQRTLANKEPIYLFVEKAATDSSFKLHHKFKPLCGEEDDGVFVKDVC